jgi:hypothetical protein
VTVSSPLGVASNDNQLPRRSSRDVARFKAGGVSHLHGKCGRTLKPRQGLSL